ncbi:MAG TPA: hypothetical protein VF905_10560 [Nitrospirota bacterium]
MAVRRASSSRFSRAVTRSDGFWRAGLSAADAGRVAVRVIRTDEEHMIAKTVCRVLGLQDGQEMCHEDEED